MTRSLIRVTLSDVAIRPPVCLYVCPVYVAQQRHILAQWLL